MMPWPIRRAISVCANWRCCSAPICWSTRATSPACKQRVEGLLAPEDPLRNAAREAIGLTQYKAGDLNAARDSFARP